MSEFKIEDTDSIKDYVRSLDIYDQFDEIVVNVVAQYTVVGRRPATVEIQIIADEYILYSHTEKRLFEDPIVEFDHYFENDIRLLSATLVFARNLISETEELQKYHIELNDSYNLVIAKALNTSHVLRVSLNKDDDAVANVRVITTIEHEDFDSIHQFQTKSVIKLEELKSVLESFRSLREEL